jgi:DNA mismatch repair protein MutL
MDNDIKLLPQNLINQIAAGEVIERPASIVKELVENSIDAGATDISIKIKHAGISEIVIIDNGSGIAATDIELAFTRHATSKISRLEDLFDIHTLGFRGEALASISSIAKVQIETRIESTDLSTIASIENSRIIEESLGNRSKGTTLIIRDLFFNVPARRKFLKSEQTEKSQVIEQFINLAIPNYNIAFKLFVDGELKYDLKSASDIQSRVTDIFKLEKEKFFVLGDNKSPLMAIFSKPEYCDNKKDYEYIFINGRAIKDAVCRKAMQQAYSTFIPNYTFPKFFLFLNLQGKEVDVNVHPRKLEVRWENSQEIFKLVHGNIRSFLEKSLRMNVNNMVRDVNQLVGSIPASQTFNSGYSAAQPKSTSNYKSNFSAGPNKSRDQNYFNNAAPILNKTNEEIRNDIHDMVNDTSQSLLFEDKSPLSGIKNIYQVLTTYLILEYPAKLLIIDQHAAAERITYDKIVLRMKKNSNVAGFMKSKMKIPEFSSQALLLPIEVSHIFGSGNEQISKYKEIFAALGLVFSEDFSQILEIPLELSTDKIEVLLKDIATFLNENTEEIAMDNIDELISSNENFKNMIATIACHNSIRAGQSLTRGESEWLITELLESTNPYSCPHGRPIIWELTQTDLEKKFGRIFS